MNRLEFVGNRDMRMSAIISILAALRYNLPLKRVKQLFNANSKEGETHALMDINNGLWLDFQRQADGRGVNVRDNARNEVRLTGTTEKGYRITVPYLVPKDKVPKAMSFDLWRNKEVLLVQAQEGEDVRIFGRVLHKLGGNPNALKEPIEINGQVLWLAYWLAAYTVRAVDDQVSYMMYVDDGSEKL